MMFIRAGVPYLVGIFFGLSFVSCVSGAHNFCLLDGDMDNEMHYPAFPFHDYDSDYRPVY